MIYNIYGKRFRVSSGFGEKRHYQTNGVWHDDVHDGIDLVPLDDPQIGTPFPTPTSGTIIRTGQPGNNRPDPTGALYIAIELNANHTMWFFISAAITQKLAARFRLAT